jgi:hypothetical protein
MPFSAPLADGADAPVPFAVAGDPCAWVCVVCAGGFCDENLELMLEIHELRRDEAFESGGVVLTIFSALPRLRIAGRLVGVFWGVEPGGDATRGGDGEVDLRMGIAFVGSVSCGLGGLGCSDGGLAGRPPWDDVLGGVSRVRPGDEGACWRW